MLEGRCQAQVKGQAGLGYTPQPGIPARVLPAPGSTRPDQTNLYLLTSSSPKR